MSIIIGGQNAKKLFVGNDEIKKVFLGGDLVYENTPPTPPTPSASVYFGTDPTFSRESDMNYTTQLRGMFSLTWRGSSLIGACAYWQPDLTSIKTIKMHFNAGTCYDATRFPCYIGITQSAIGTINPVFDVEAHGGVANTSFTLSLDVSSYTGVHTFACKTPGWNITQAYIEIEPMSGILPLNVLSYVREGSMTITIYDETNYKWDWNVPQVYIGALCYWCADLTDIDEISISFSATTCYNETSFPCKLGIATQWGQINPTFDTLVQGGSQNSDFTLTLDVSSYVGVQYIACSTSGWNITINSISAR